MIDPVVEVLAERTRETPGLRAPVLVSFGIHVGAVVIALLASHFSSTLQARPKMMTINLAAGSQGPKSTGMTDLGGRPVEKVAPPPKRPEPIKPVPPKADTIAVPTKTPPKPQPKPEAKAPEPPPPVPVRPPTTGAEVQSGTSRVETNVHSQGTGLATGGSFGGAQDVVIDPKFKFCCQAYVDQMLEIIKRGWTSNVGVNGEVTLHFTILRDGSIVDIGPDKASSLSLQRVSISALYNAQAAGGLGKLPPEFTDDKLIVHLRFPYVR